MKKFLMILAAIVIVVFPNITRAGILIDLTIATSGTTTVASGQSDFQVEATSGTYDPAIKRPYTLGLSAGDVTIANIDHLDLSKTWSIQIDELAVGQTLDGDNSGATYSVLAQWSNDDASWTLAGTSELISGTALSGNTRYVITFPPNVSRFMRLIFETGITIFQTAKAKLLIP